MTVIEAAPVLQSETKSFRGSYLLFRKTAQGLKRKTGTSRPPRFRHQSFESAETEAKRLLGLFPGSTFIIMQEVARVKMKPIDPNAAAGCADDYEFNAVSLEAPRWRTEIMRRSTT